MAEDKKDQPKLLVWVEMPTEIIVEDSDYPIEYKIKNLSDSDFLGGRINFSVRIAGLDPLRYNHWWRNTGIIKAGETKPLTPKPVKAIAGANVVLFETFEPIEQSENFIVVNLSENELDTVQSLAHLRVRSSEEINSDRNLKIAAYSMGILVLAQIVDWILQLWIAGLSECGGG